MAPANDIDVSNDATARGQSWPLWVPVVGVLILHLLAARLASLWTLDPDAAQPFWPANGVTVGAALMVSKRHRWWAVAGGLVGHGVNSAVFLGSSAYNLSGDLLANGVEIVLAVLIAQWLFDGREDLDQLGRTVTGLACCLAAAAVGAAIATLWFDVPDASDLFWSWTVGDGLGLFTAGSLMLVGRTQHWLLDASPRERGPELVLIAAATVVTAYVAFEVEPLLIYLMIASLLWLAARFGPRIAVPAAALIVVYSCVRTADGVGPFSVDGEPRLFQLQAFNAAAMIAAVVVSRLSREMDQKRRAVSDLFAKLERSEERWKKLARSGYEGVIEVDRDEVIIGVTSNYASALNLRPDDLLGFRLRDFFSAEEFATTYAAFAERILSGEAVRFDRPYRTTNGATGWALTSAEPALDENGNFDGALMFVLDTTDIHRLNKERAESEIALHNLRSDERHRIAQAIHDGALQEISAATMMVGSLKNDPTGGVDIDRIEDTLVGAMGKLREDTIGLADGDLEAHTISQALGVVAERFVLPQSTDVTIEDRGIGAEANASTDALFRIAREALVNAIVHSDGESISIDLDATDDGYRVVVEDDGKGFDLARAIRKYGHLGLRTISEQADAVGGWVTTSTPASGGTRVEAWAPRLPTAPSKDVSEANA